MSKQLLLDVQVESPLKLEDFICMPENQATYDALDAMFNQSASVDSNVELNAGSGLAMRHLYLYGVAASGKTHLLEGLCYKAQQQSLPAVYFSLYEQIKLNPQKAFAVLQPRLQSAELICVDDVHLLVQSREWQEAFFHFYNQIQEQGNVHLVLAANDVPEALGLHIADLESRLKWGLSYRIAPLNEKYLAELLRSHMKKRSLDFDDKAIEFILRRAQRSTSALMAILEKLDEASWQEQRAVSVNFVKKVLDW